MRPILRDDVIRIIQILKICASWRTEDSRVDFIAQALTGLDKSEQLVTDIKFAGSQSSSAREAVLKIQAAGAVYFVPFLRALQEEVFEEQDSEFLKKIQDEIRKGREAVSGGAEVPPDTLVYEVGRAKTLARIGRVMELALAGQDSGAGIVVFQGDVKLDCTPGFLLRLRWDRDRGVPLYITPEMRCWANWEAGKQIELTDCPVDGDADRDGSKRTDWCLEELMKRFSRPEQRRRGNARQEFLRLVSELEHSTYFLVHSLDASEPISHLDAFLKNYLSFWKNLDFPQISNIRFLVVIRVDSKSADNPGLRGVRDAIAQALGKPVEDVASGILAEDIVSLSFHPKLEDVRYRDAEQWIERLHGKIDEAQHQGYIDSWASGDALKREVEKVVNESLFPNEEGVRKMVEVEPVLRRAYDLFRTAVSKRRGNG